MVQEREANRLLRESLGLLVLAGGCAALVWFDQFCKQLALSFLVPGEVVAVLDVPGIGNVCLLTLVWNTGAFLSLGAGGEGWLHKLFMIILPGLAIGAMAAWLARPWACMVFRKPCRSVGVGLRIAVALFIAGGCGNLVDRIWGGKVVDFLNFGIGPVRTGIMNVADLYIAAGLVVALVHYVRQRKANRGTGTMTGAGTAAKPDN